MTSNELKKVALEGGNGQVTTVPLKIPAAGTVARSDNGREAPGWVCSPRPTPPESLPLSKEGFSSNVAPQGGMKNSFEAKTKEPFELIRACGILTRAVENFAHHSSLITCRLYDA